MYRAGDHISFIDLMPNDISHRYVINTTRYVSLNPDRESHSFPIDAFKERLTLVTDIFREPDGSLRLRDPDSRNGFREPSERVRSTMPLEVSRSDDHE